MALFSVQRRLLCTPQRLLSHVQVLSCLLAMSSWVIPASAQVTVDHYVFKSHDLPSQVAEAMHEGKESDSEPVKDLMEQHKNDPDKVLMLLKPYLRETDFDSRLTIIEAASCAPHSMQAIEFLTALAPDPRVGYYAVESFYDHFTASQIVKEGGKPLQLALYRGAVGSRITTYGYLLLSCYKANQAAPDNVHILAFLQRRRQSFETPQSPPSTQGTQPGRIFSSPQDSNRIYEKMALDLALVELGDTEALKRIQQVFAAQKTPELLALLPYLKFVDNKDVLASVVELLHNKNIAQKITDSFGNPQTSPRVCDEVLVKLQSRVGIKSRKMWRLTSPNYSDPELNENYALIKTALGLK